MFIFVRLIAKDHMMLRLICTTSCSIPPNLWVTITHIHTYLIVFKDSEEHSDILTNLQASQSHLDFINTGFLRALDSLPTSITSTLETAPPPHQPSMAVPHISDATSVNASTGLNSRPAPKKVRMSRVPAGVIPGVTPAPDPERWLKKSERSTYGQGKRRKGPGGGGATQGSASVDRPVTPISHPSKTGGGKGKKKR
jgi:signal recognition particle subunit SRP72